MKAIKAKEFRKKLESLGGCFTRWAGSHEIWTMPNGTTVSLAGGKKDHGEISPGVIRQVRKVLEDAGYALEV